MTAAETHAFSVKVLAGAARRCQPKHDETRKARRDEKGRLVRPANLDKPPLPAPRLSEYRRFADAGRSPFGDCGGKLASLEPTMPDYAEQIRRVLAQLPRGVRPGGLTGLRCPTS